jgi:hypothetical protein
VFVRVAAHNSADDFRGTSVVPEGEFKAHTWEDATLRELGELVQAVHPDARRRGATMDLALVYPGRDVRVREGVGGGGVGGGQGGGEFKREGGWWWGGGVALPLSPCRRSPTFHGVEGVSEHASEQELTLRLNTTAALLGLGVHHQS